MERRKSSSQYKWKGKREVVKNEEGKSKLWRGGAVFLFFLYFKNAFEKVILFRL